MTTKLSPYYPITCHTDNVGPGSIFVVIKGQKLDGSQFIKTAIEKGAREIVIERDAFINSETASVIERFEVSVRRTDNARRALAQLSAQAHGYPARRLKLIAITGTKGKTTTAHIVHHIFKTAGFKTALLTTVGNSIGDDIFANSLTTEQPDYLHAFFHECVTRGVTHVIMEVAAQAVSLERVHGLFFDGLIFTNFEQAHGEFYSNVADYFDAKRQLLDQCKPKAPILINRDNLTCSTLLKNNRQYKGFGLAGSEGISVNRSFFYGVVDSENQHELSLEIFYNQDALTLHCSSLLGKFSAYNALAAAALALEFDVPEKLIQNAFATLPPVPGRLERYPLANGALCIIDHAHNPLSFESILSALRPLTDQLIVVFSCGGDRDTTMRPVMGALAAQYADLIVLTTDNPRSEDPLKIIEQIKGGIVEEKDKVEVVLDRDAAINCAYKQSKPGTIIALLGRGRQAHQIIGNEMIPFTDRGSIESLLAR